MTEAKASTLVIHMDDRSTDFLKAIYDGLGYQVVTGSMSQAQAEKAIQAYSRVFMLGHGGPFGLFTRGFSMTDRIGQLLSEKPDGLYIWCNADAYAVRHKLSGLVSGMFISEVGEAAMFGIKATQEEVDASNAAFSKAVREALNAGAPHATVRERYTHATCAITKYNNERLYVFDKGTPSPALHPSSASFRCNAPSQGLSDFPQKTKHDWDDEDRRINAAYDLVGYWVGAVWKDQVGIDRAAAEIAQEMFASEYQDQIADTISNGILDKIGKEGVIEQVMNVVMF